MESQCPKCQGWFQCCAGNISNCFCLDIHLTQAQRQTLKATYEGCLCPQCLSSFTNKPSSAPQSEAYYEAQRAK